MIDKGFGLAKLSHVSKIGIILLVIMLLMQGIFIPTVLSNDQAETTMGTQDLPISQHIRGSKRTVLYDMNTTHNALHQKLTIFGKRAAEIVGDRVITSMAVGDVNVDGLDDLIIGAAGDNGPTKGIDSGIVFVFFGVPNLPETYDLNTHSMNNLTIYGDQANNGLGSSLVVADFNNDTFDDIIVGAEPIDTVYIFFGGQYLSSPQNIWDLEFLDANSTIIGETGISFGSSLAAGDFNQDGMADIVVGAPTSKGSEGLKNDCGEVWIIEGYNQENSVFNLQIQPYPAWVNNVTTIYGKDGLDVFGSAVASGKDFNGDGFDDIGVSAPGGGGPTGFDRPFTGESYIFYWYENMSSVIDLALTNVEANITIYGNHTQDRLGEHSIAFGDVNDDQLTDFIIGTPRADGKLISNTGETNIIYGSKYYPKKHIFNFENPFNRSNVSIIFPDLEDNSGTWVDALDWNGDNIDDILITATGGDGRTEFFQNIGEIIIINGSHTLSKFIDIGNKDPGFLILGAESEDALGGFTAYGDFDGDAKIDLAAFARGGDGDKNLRLDSGEIYVIPGAIAFAPRIRSLDFLNGDGSLNSKCYARYKTYNFEVNITTPLGLFDLVELIFTIDPFNTYNLTMKYHWDGMSLNFIELYDPFNYAEITSMPPNATSGSSNGVDYWRLSFNLIFNWTCHPIEDLIPIHIELYSSHNYHISRTFLQMFNVESRLNFTGSLMVKDGNDEIINDNDWLKGGKSTTWSGLTVVYENTTDMYPNPSEYEIFIWNNTNSWNITSIPGTAISKKIKIGTTSIAQDVYHINITKIPLDKDLSNITFRLRVDADNIEFTNPLPSSKEWQTESPVTCEITLTDYGGTQVDAESIEYRITENNGVTWTAWTSAGITSDDTYVHVEKDIPFSDGQDNYIQWRGGDTIGNGIITTEQYLIKVDTKNVTFKNAYPDTDQIFDTLEINFGIEISDNTSGVNASTIEYSYSKDNGLVWSYWINANLTGIHTTIEANATRKFGIGDVNLVKWRASDAAGNGPNETEPQRFQIFIATKDLKTNLIDPVNYDIVPTATPKLIWDCNDNSSNIVYDVYLSRVLSDVVDFKKRIKPDITEKFYVIENPLTDKEIYYWTVIPRNITGKRGVNVDGYWSFQVDLDISNGEEPDTPVTSVKYPLNGSTINTLQPELKWSVKYKNPLNLDLTYEIELWESLQTTKETVKDLTETDYKWTDPHDPLGNNKKYYWRVGVTVEGFKRVYWSPIWEFNTDAPPAKEFYDFNLETDDETTFKIKQGNTKQITFKVRNLKETTGTVVLSISSFNMEESLFDFSKESVTVQGFESIPVVLTVSIPEDLTKGDYLFSIVGKMKTDYGILEDELDFKVTVTAKDDVDGPGDEDGEGDDYTIMLIGIAIVIIIIVILLLFLLLKRKKKREEEAPELPMERMETPTPTEPEYGIMEAPPMAEPMPPMATPITEATPTEPIEGEVPGVEETTEEALPPEAIEPVEGTEPIPSAGEPVPTTPEMEEGEVSEPLPEEPAPEEFPPETPPETDEPGMPSDLPDDAYQQSAETPEPEAEQDPGSETQQTKKTIT